MFPRACKMVVEGNKEKQEYYSKISLLVVSFIGMASLFGLLAISDEFAVYYYGEDFAISGIVMKAMCGLPLIIGIGDIVRLQWMIPNKMDKQYTLCVILNAIINIIISCLLIPKIGIYGAVIGTLSAELFGCIFQIVLCKGFLSFKLIISTMIPFLLIGGLMYLGIFLVDLFDLSGLLSLLIKIIVGIVIYCTLSLIYLFVFEKELSSTLKRTIINKLKRKK
jgi:O-antigen/teichoic acid export membrane protein